MSVPEYDVVLLPSPELREQAIATSEQLAKQKGGQFILDDQHEPHLSLYMVPLEADVVQEAVARLEIVAQAIGPQAVRAVAYQLARGYLDVEFKKTEALVAIQKDVVDRINPLRRNAIMEFDASLVDKVFGEVLENIMKYGFRTVGPNHFRPHMTFTRFADEHTRVDLRGGMPRLATFSGTFDRLGLYKLGQHGTCSELVAAFDLQAS